MSYRYYIYGMHVESDIEIPEALPDNSNSAPEVFYRLGIMPEPERTELKSIPVNQFTIKRVSDGVIFRIADTADYYVTKDTITVEVRESADPHSVKCFVLGSSSGFLFILRGMVAIHGGAICQNGKGIIMTGESGAGKSTVSNSLRTLGYDFISDDVCVISQAVIPRVNLAYPQQKLCRDAAVKMGYSLKELIYINEQRDKFAVRLKDGYKPDGEELKYIFEIMLTDDEEVSFTKLQGHDALQCVIRNVYRGTDGFRMFGMNPLYMKSVINITKNVAVYRINRPKDKDTLDYIVNEVNRIVSL